jgi:hypothetical protein
MRGPPRKHRSSRSLLSWRTGGGRCCTRRKHGDGHSLRMALSSFKTQPGDLLDPPPLPGRPLRRHLHDSSRTVPEAGHRHLLGSGTKESLLRRRPRSCRCAGCGLRARGDRPREARDMAGEMMRITLEIAARTLFGSEVPGRLARLTRPCSFSKKVTSLVSTAFIPRRSGSPP